MAAAGDPAAIQSSCSELHQHPCHGGSGPSLRAPPVAHPAPTLVPRAWGRGRGGGPPGTCALCCSSGPPTPLPRREGGRGWDGPLPGSQGTGVAGWYPGVSSICEPTGGGVTIASAPLALCADRCLAAHGPPWRLQYSRPRRPRSLWACFGGGCKIRVVIPEALTACFRKPVTCPLCLDFSCGSLSRFPGRPRGLRPAPRGLWGEAAGVSWDSAVGPRPREGVGGAGCQLRRAPDAYGRPSLEELPRMSPVCGAGLRHPGTHYSATQ